MGSRISKSGGELSKYLLGRALGYLVLETGEVYTGIWANAPAGDLDRGSLDLQGFHRAGEVVFNTSHSGYEEVATDPSYYSQIVVMTAPMQGNYGVQRAEKVWESRRLWIEGFLALQIQSSPRDRGWLDLLRDEGIPALSEVDTRAVTLRLRSQGTTWGALIVGPYSSQEARALGGNLVRRQRQLRDQDPAGRDWAHAVSRSAKEVRGASRSSFLHSSDGVGAREADSDPGRMRKLRVGVLDFGCKENILRELEERGAQLVLFPSRTSCADILVEKLDGLVLSNGPGDPQNVQMAVGVVRELIGKIPILGICMGHQILSLALGASTYKLRFGHRGANHPIRDDLLRQVYVSSQNHGYAVQSSTLPSDILVTQVNLNDRTVAGFYSQQRNCLGIQYHPESHPGPHEAQGLFDFFIQRMIHQAKGSS